jgi:Protein of unknown function (DUF3626)
MLSATRVQLSLPVYSPDTRIAELKISVKHASKRGSVGLHALPKNLAGTNVVCNVASKQASLVMGICSNDSYDDTIECDCPADIDPPTWELIQRLQCNEEGSRQGNTSMHQNVQFAVRAEDEDGVSEPVYATIDDDIKSLALAIALADEDREFQRQRRESEESRGLALALKMQGEQETTCQEQQTIKAPKNDRQLRSSVLHLLRNRTQQEELEMLQRGALEYVMKKAQQLHKQAMDGLTTRYQLLGFQPEDVDSCLDYIRHEAPIVIHVSEQTLGYLTYDTYYRSAFELGTAPAKALKARKKWESGLFGGWYDNCAPSHRPKYGCLNIFGDIRGVKCARGYGRVVLTLANHVRHRSTFLDKDSSINCTSTLATSEFYGHVLSQYSNDELQAVMNVSRNRGTQCRCNHYKEVQIHGPISLATDIQAMSMPGKEADASDVLREVVQQFQTITGCNVLWQGDLV